MVRWIIVCISMMLSIFYLFLDCHSRYIDCTCEWLLNVNHITDYPSHSFNTGSVDCLLFDVWFLEDIQVCDHLKNRLTVYYVDVGVIAEAGEKNHVVNLLYIIAS